MDIEKNDGTEEVGAPLTAHFIEVTAEQATADLPAGHYVRGLDGKDDDGNFVLRGPFETQKVAREAVVIIITNGILAGIGVSDVGDGSLAEFVEEDDGIEFVEDDDDVEGEDLEIGDAEEIE